MAIEGKSVLAIIPARGGSKRVPKKNVKPFRGKPLLEWTVDEAIKSKYIDKFILSTDMTEASLLVIGKPIHIYTRPDELLTDTASSEDVMRFHLSAHPHDWIVLLQPTSPLRTVEDIDACIERAQLGYGCISTTRGVTNGAVYVCTKEWLAKHDFRYGGLMLYEMPEERSLDINFPEDFDR